MKNVKFFRGEDLPLELHKVRVVQKLHLVPIERRLDALKEGGFNTFRLQTTDVFLDMLTDSGTNAMSDNQLAAMLRADDAYAGSQSFVRLQKAVEDVLGKKYLLPVQPRTRCGEHHCAYFHQARSDGTHELPLHHDSGSHPGERR